MLGSGDTYTPQFFEFDFLVWCNGYSSAPAPRQKAPGIRDPKITLVLLNSYRTVDTEKCFSEMSHISLLICP